MLLEIIAVIFSLICVILTIKQNIWCWLTGMIGISSYFILFLQNLLYAEMVLQIIFFIQSIYGWYNWNIGKIDNHLPVTKVKKLYLLPSIIIISSAIISIILYNYTNSTYPIIDSSTAVISLYANWLLTRKKIESWYLWILVDILLIGLFISKGLYISSVLYSIFFILSINGLNRWRKDLYNAKSGIY